MPRIKIKSTPKADSGKLIPLTDDMQLFSGKSHEQGGMPYMGVEVEGGETAYKNLNGDTTIFGNMLVPGTNKKFKDVSKALAKKEQKVDKLIDKGTILVNTANPLDRWEELAFNSGRVMMEGGARKKMELKQSKEHLSSLQEAMLQMADEMGADPQMLSKGKLKAAKGATIKYENGGDPEPKKKKPSMAVRMNNPGNIKYGEFARKLGAVKGDPATDGGYFAKFPDTDTGLKALRQLLKTKNYANLSVDSAIKRWTNNSGYSVDYKDIAGKKVSELSGEEFEKLVNTITMGEDGRYYKQPSGSDTTTTKKETFIQKLTDPILNIFDPNKVNNPGDKSRRVNKEEYDLSITDPKPYSLSSAAKGLDPVQILPELFAAANNKTEPVHMQQYNPQLYQSYNVSFQDRLNENQTSFNSISRLMEENPAALSVLAAQKYGADNQVMGEEFRTNQQIEADITNKNIALLNDAEMKNLQLADQQFVRQSQAKTNTKALNNTILNSVAAKIKQNQLEQQTVKLYENLFNFRPDENLKMLYEGPHGNEYIQYPSALSTGLQPNQSTVQKLDKSGNPVSTTIKTDSKLDAEKTRAAINKLNTPWSVYDNLNQDPILRMIKNRNR